MEAELESIRQKLESSEGSCRSVSGSARESLVVGGSDGSVSGEGCGLATYSRKYGVSGVRTKKRRRLGCVMFECGKGGFGSGARCQLG